MELSLGLWTNEMLSKWFGIKEKTFRNTKEKKLKELEEYCNFERQNGKINIIEIYKPVYVKKKSKNYREIRNNVDKYWSENGLDSCKHVSNKIMEELKLPMAFTTAYNYTREARNELYGKPFQESGILGNCVYLWCKRNLETGELSFFTEEEEKIKAELKIKYFGDVSEKQLFVKEMVALGEIKKEDAWQLLEELTNMDDRGFMNFLVELQERIGCQVVRGTLVNRNAIKYFEAKKNDLIEI